MKFLLSNKSAAVIATSLPAMERYRQPLSAAIGAYMARGESLDPNASSSQLAGLAITDMLFAHARQFAAARSGPRASETKRSLQTLDLPKERLTCFGDGLGAVIKDVLRAEASPEVLSAWGDAYWAMVRAGAHQDRSLAA